LSPAGFSLGEEWNPRAYTVNNLPAGMKQAIGDARTAYMNAAAGSQAERDAMAAHPTRIFIEAIFRRTATKAQVLVESRGRKRR